MEIVDEIHKEKNYNYIQLIKTIIIEEICQIVIKRKKPFVQPTADTSSIKTIWDVDFEEKEERNAIFSFLEVIEKYVSSKMIINEDFKIRLGRDIETLNNQRR